MSKFDSKPKKGFTGKPRSLFEDEDTKETSLSSSLNRPHSSLFSSSTLDNKDTVKEKKKSSSTSTDNLDFTINRKFAASYEERKRRQELERAKELGITLSSENAEENEDDSEANVEEDDGKQLTKTMDKQILNIIHAIRNKDPKIYDPTVKYFSTPPASDGEDETSSKRPPSATTTNNKKITAKDVLRQQLLDAAEQGKTDAFDEDEDLTLSKRTLDNADRSIKSRMYDEEQKLLRQEFLSTVSNEAEKFGFMQKSSKSSKKGGKGGAGNRDGINDDKEEEEEDNFLQIRRKITPTTRIHPDDDSDADSELSQERNELKKYLQDKSGKGIAEHAQDLANPDKFLTAFMGSRAWKDLEKEEKDDSDNDDDNGSTRSEEKIQKVIEDDEEDEEELWKADDFEAAYNFRFEEPNGGQIVTYNSRKLPEDSLRVKDNKRKEARERKKERKDIERAEAEAETRRLINLKRAELKSRMSRIKDIAGNGVDLGKLAEVFGDNLDKDFDPDEYDKQMNALFNDDYYAEAELEATNGSNENYNNDIALQEARADKKTKKDKKKKQSKDDDDSTDSSSNESNDEEAPASEDDDDNLPSKNVPAWIFGDGPRPAWAGPSAEELAEGKDDFDIDKVIANDDDNGMFIDGDDDPYDGGEGPDVSYDPAIQGRRRREGKRKREAKKRMSAVARVKSILAAEAKAVQERQRTGGNIDEADEILALGFEDIIAGGLKTRFKYKTVPPQDYGLTTEEILLADDKELNNYVGLRRMAPYREQEWTVPKKRRQRAVSEIRKNVSREIERLGIDKSNIGGKKGHAVDNNDEDDDGVNNERTVITSSTKDRNDDEEKKSKKHKKEKKERKEKKQTFTDDDNDNNEKEEVEEETEIPTATKSDNEEDSNDEGEEENTDNKDSSNGERKRKRRRKHKKSHDEDPGKNANHSSVSTASTTGTTVTNSSKSETKSSSSHPSKESKPHSHDKHRSSDKSSSHHHHHHHHHDKSQIKKDKRDAKKGDTDKMVTLSSGGQIKQSRLSSYQ